MDIKYTIKDNFLDPVDFEKIKNFVLGNKFPWFFEDNVAYTGKHNTHFYWTHGVFRHGSGVVSPLCNILSTFLNKLEAKAFIRIKANLYSRDDKITEHEKHVDYNFKHKGALFSVNTCNGFTMLADGTKIESVENRLLLFDPSLPHHSSTCTDAKVRVNININYF